MTVLGSKTLLEIYVEYEKNSCWSFLVPKILKRAIYWFEACQTHFERLVWGWQEDTFGIFENMVIDLGGKTLLEVKYEKSGCFSA